MAARQPPAAPDLDNDLDDEGDDDLRPIGNAPAEAGASRRDDRRAHASRVDELAEEHATHPDDEYQPWVRPSSLDAPPPRPGMVQRWVRVQLKGADDPRNRTRRLREGWKPRALDSIPEDWVGFGMNQGDVKGAFVVDDLMLCEMPERIAIQRRKHYARMTAQQMEAVEADLESAQVGGHRILRSHKTTVTHPARVVGRKVEAADD